MVLLENAWLAAVAATLAWLLILAALAMYRKRNDINPPADNVLRWIWSDQRIIQMSPDALDLMQRLQIPITTQAVIHILSARFSDLLDMDFTALTGPITIASDWPHDRGVLQVSPLRNGVMSFIVTETAGQGDLFIQNRAIHVLDQVESVVQSTPFPVWQANQNNTIIESNLAFRNLTDALGERLHDIATHLQQSDERVQVENTRGQQFWFDVNFHEIDDRTVYYALDVTAVVKAEQAQRNFVQTLTKTFATLSIGLAIFDRNRQLVLFNPALVDLTTLPAEFLSARPNLLSVFDKLRDRHIMPEPKNYASWREKLAVLVAAAAEGTFSEVWNLPNGQIYRISGRPHPDGALAFLFEDITAEVSVTRKYRSELEFYYSLLDQMGTAVAVFSMSGTMILSNEAHQDLWGISESETMRDTTFDQAQNAWQLHSRPSPFWGDLREFLSQIDHRTVWHDRVMLDDGREIECTVLPLPDQHTAVTFRHLDRSPKSNSDLITISA